MNLSERILQLCDQLGLVGIAQNFDTLAQQAVEKQWTLSEYLQACLQAEQALRAQRTRNMLVRFAGFPAIKTLDAYDFDFAVGAPKAAIDQLATLAFVHRRENVVFLCQWPRILTHFGQIKLTHPPNWLRVEHREKSPPGVCPSAANSRL